jgi:flagellar biosynthesis component FlhA
MLKWFNIILFFSIPIIFCVALLLGINGFGFAVMFGIFFKLMLSAEKLQNKNKTKGEKQNEKENSNERNTGSTSEADRISKQRYLRKIRRRPFTHW